MLISDQTCILPLRAIILRYSIALFCALFSLDIAALAAPHKVSLLAKRRPACSDRKDNDGDGLKDYPKDPGCKNRFDNSEYNRAKSPTGKPTDPGAQETPNLGSNASLNGMRPFPNNNDWNLDISDMPVDPNSYNLISSIGLTKGLHPDFGTVWNGAPIGIPYYVVSGSQAMKKITFTDYGDESDPGPYPIPDDAKIEGGESSDGDRHVIVIDRDNKKLYEMYRAFKTSSGWNAACGAVYDLTSNALRPLYWTSADAAGLPIFPGLVRYDEVIERGEIRHALRFTANNTRRAFVKPARHYASSKLSTNLPPMGMRVRLKKNVDISGFSSEVQVILRALKKYGMILADNGSDWFISGAPDSRWNDDNLHELGSIKGSDFEVVKMGEIIQ